MPVELEKLKAAGITEEKLKAKFDYTKGGGWPEDENVKALVVRLQGRIQDGRTWNYANYKLYHAIDLLWETPFRAQDEALLRSLERRDWNKEENRGILKEWALQHLLTERQDPKTGKKEQILNLPKFLNVVVPLASSATKTRAGRLTIDRMQFPLFKYEPRKSLPKDNARCEALTDYVETVTEWFDYRNQLQQNILKTCQYPNQLTFVREAWYREEQAGKLQKEGLRYSLPHPTRVYHDLTFPISSFNTDIGCQFAGYWQVQAYRNIRENKRLWNVEKIALGPNWRGPNTTFFNTVYPCTLVPWPSEPGITQLDREKAATIYFQTQQDDYGIVLTQHFEKIVPKDWGLGDYSDPVWFRFIVASDITVIFAEPLPSCPIQYWGYDPDDSRTLSSSMILEAAPWEYLVTNLLTTLIIGIKQNLANLTFYNSDVVDETIMNSLKDVTDANLQLLRMVPMSFRKQRASQNDVRESVLPITLPQRETVSVMSAINMAINLMERCLVMSPQEAGAAASHQQSAEEMKIISNSMSTRLEYTGLAIDRAIEAWKRQLYYYIMAYGSSEVYAEVTADKITKKQLEDMGFTVDETESTDEHFVVRGKKDTLQMEYFVASKDGPNRTNGAAVAQAMVTILQPLAPQLAASVGPEEVTKLFNQWAETAGLPRTFRLKATPGLPQKEQEMMAKMGEQMAGAMQQQEAHVKEAFTAQAQAMQGIQQQLAQMGEAIQQLAQVVPGLAQQIQAVEAELQPLKEGVVQAIALGKSNQEVTAKLAALLASAAPQPINDDTAGITGGGLPGHPGDMAIPPGAEPLGGGVPPEMVPPPGGVPLPLGP